MVNVEPVVLDERSCRPEDDQIFVVEDFLLQETNSVFFPVFCLSDDTFVLQTLLQVSTLLFCHLHPKVIT